MELSGRRILVTGGAGFVGSHLADALLPDNEVVVADDLSNGRREWVPDGASFTQVDLAERAGVEAVVDADLELVVHAAADKDAARDDVSQFRSNTTITAGLLERMDEVGVDRLVFTSSSVVYGEAPRPTPEAYGPLEPISVYGAAKVAEEGLCSVYAHSHDVRTWVFRFANLVGPRLRGAVIPDFIEKLRSEPETLTILGDGRQEKSYLHVSDCVRAIRHVIEHADEPYNVYNLGTSSTTSVDTIAAIVADEMGVDPDHEYTGGVRGWTGDVPRMRLAVERLGELGFEPDLESDEAVRTATRELLEEL
jgi:UDP-glucose 4-epimerase